MIESRWDEIVTKLRQVEVLQGQGMAVSDAVRQIGVTQHKPIIGGASCMAEWTGHS